MLLNDKRQDSLSPTVQKLADGVVAGWRQHRPTLAAWQSGLEAQAYEDLSDEGLKAWQDWLYSAKDTINSIQSHCLNVFDQVLLDELMIFIESQLYQMVNEQQFRRGLGPYLQLATLLFVRITDEPGILLEKLQIIAEWFDQATNRLSYGLRPGKSDLLFIDNLAKNIKKAALKWLQLHTNQQFNDLLHSILAILDIWAKLPAVEPTMFEDLDYVFDKIFRSKLSLDQWINKLIDRTKQEIEVFNSSQKRSDSLQTLWTQSIAETNSCNDPFEANNLQKTDSESLWNGQLVDWSLKVSAELRQKATKIFFIGPSKASKEIRIAADFYKMLIPNAAFVPKPPGQMLLAPVPLHQPTVKFFLDLALSTAHELSPGHGEQYAQAAPSPLARYLRYFPNQLGLEGWALYAERVLCQFGPAAEVVFRYQQIRRLLPTTVALARSLLGRSLADKVAKSLISSIEGLSSVPPGLYQAGSLVYALGLIEVEEALADLQSGSKANPAEIIGRFMAQGAVHPGNAQRLLIGGGFPDFQQNM